MTSLSNLEFMPLLITEVFDSVRASRAWYDKSKLTTHGDKAFPFVSRGRADNGVDSFCTRQEKDPEPGNAITIGLDTQTLGYQPVPFYTSQNIQVLRHKNLDMTTALVLTSLIKSQLGKFSWGGNGATLGRLMRSRIMVPAVLSDNSDPVVNWEGIRVWGGHLLGKVVDAACETRDTSLAADEPPTLAFSPMLIPEVFQTMGTASNWFDVSQSDRVGEPRHPYVVRSGGGNGIGAFLPTQGFQPPNSGNAITIGVSTSTVFYQPVSFYSSREIQVLRHPRLTLSSGLVLVAVLRKQMSKFQWGNGASLARLRATRVMVPTTVGADGVTSVDWDGMEKYGEWLRAQVDSRTDEALASLTEDRLRTPQPETRGYDASSLVDQG